MERLRMLQNDVGRTLTRMPGGAAAQTVGPGAVDSHAARPDGVGRNDAGMALPTPDSNGLPERALMTLSRLLLADSEAIRLEAARTVLQHDLALRADRRMDP